MDSKQVLARFEAERQALALMEHPNIARVLDAGRTPSGRPYFVMELVKGQPIAKYCDEKRLGVRERLELFGDVCRAVQHAHQKGIIHRDLKPSNVLVAPYDGKPVVKVIDFGVAKATGQRLTDKTLFTGFGALVGTTEYMSPEQAEVNNQDIDTRSDIYSLGVLLYELLTGSTPLTRKRIKEVALLEVLRLIREQEPPKPSTRLSESKDSLPSISAQRQTEPAKLTKLVRGELDWIVMKALDKDRNRRYETANGFAMDVQRYLADEPVQAGPPSAWYRFRKFARRNKTALAVAGLILFFIALLGGGGGWVIRDREAREEAVAKERLDRQQRLTAQVEPILAEVDRLEREQKWPEARAAVERAEAALAGGKADDAVRRHVQDAHRDLAFVTRLDRIGQDFAIFDEGKPDLGRAARDYALAFRDYGVDVEALSPEEAVAGLRRNRTLAVPVADALMIWAWARRDQGEGERRHKPLVTVARALDPDPLRDRLRAMWTRPLTAGLQAELMELAKAMDVKIQTQATIYALANSLYTVKLVEPSVRILQEGWHAHPDDFFFNLSLGARLKDSAEVLRYSSIAVSLRPDSAVAHYNLGNALKSQGKLDESVIEYRRAIELDSKYRAAHNNLGLTLAKQKKLDEAIAAYKKAIELDAKDAKAYNNLGNARLDQKKLPEAIAAFRKAIDLDPKDAAAYTGLGNALQDKGQLDEAIAHHKKAIELDPNSAVAYNNLGVALDYQKKLPEAIAAFRKAIELDPNSAMRHNNLGNALRQQRKLDEAITHLNKAIELEPKFANAYYNLGIALYDQKKLDAAIACHQKAIELDSKNAKAYTGLAHVRRAQGKLEEACRLYQVAIALDPQDAWAQYDFGAFLFDCKHDIDGALVRFQKAIELDPKNAKAHSGLADVRKAQGKLDESFRLHQVAVALGPEEAEVHNNFGAFLCACKHDYDRGIVEFEKAIKLDPKHRSAHFNLGGARRYKGDLHGAVTAFREAIRLDAKDAAAHSNLGECERLIELDGKLPGFLEHKTMPASSQERIELGGLCTLKRLYRAAARFYAEAFAAERTLANDLGSAHRYNAACASALAGCGQGKDVDKLDDKERARLRRQALDWLHADLEATRLLLEKDANKAGLYVIGQMRHWLADPDFTGVREPEALAKLHEAERQAWQRLWNDVADMLKWTEQKTAPEKKSGAK
jgi:tetratricopeptide (TPR) repeat protein